MLIFLLISCGFFSSPIATTKTFEQLQVKQTTYKKQWSHKSHMPLTPTTASRFRDTASRFRDKGDGIGGTF